MNADVSALLKLVNKKFGEGTLVILGSDQKVEVPVIPTGSVGLDRALGIGGWPRGRIVEVYGPERGGKTTLALHAIAESQKRGGIAAFIDAEHSLDVEYARTIGVDTETLLLSQPMSAEDGLETVDMIVRSGTVDIIVIDSVAAMVPKVELEGEMGSSHIGVQARLMGQALRKLAAITSKSNTLIFFINQIRMKIGVMYGSPEVTPGGEALKFFSSVRCRVSGLSERRKNDQKEETAGLTRVKVVKNKLAVPYKSTDFWVVFGQGIDKNYETMEALLNANVLQKNGAWFSYNGENVAHGKEQLLEFVASKEWDLSQLEIKVDNASGPEEEESTSSE